MSDINMKGHKKHMKWRMNVLSLREIHGWSAYKITSVLWDHYRLNNISKSGLLSFVTRIMNRGTVQDRPRSVRSKSKRTLVNIRKTRERHLNTQNPGQRATAAKLNDIVEYPASSTKKSALNYGSDEKRNSSTSSGSSISVPSLNDLLAYPASSTKKFGLNYGSDGKINSSASSGSSISVPSSNDILYYPASSTKKNSFNNSSDEKINYSVSNSITSGARVNDIQLAASSNRTEF